MVEHILYTMRRVKKHFPATPLRAPRSLFVRFMTTGVIALPCPDIYFSESQITDEIVFPSKTQEQGRGLTHTEPIMCDVVGYEGLYKVTHDGRVWSIKSNRWASIYLRDDRGWLAVTLCKAGKQRTLKPHRLVAEAFIPNPDNKPHINHIDGNKLNNHFTNLEWVTHQENTNHAKANGLMWFQKGKYAEN